jgi:pimeloyl-ACP methyl ester carboxylesterase
LAVVKTLKWFEVDERQKSLPTLDRGTTERHTFHVQREAIPLIFVPGIMGTRLRRTAGNREPFEATLPEVRWNPDSGSLLWKYCGASPAFRKQMLVGESFSPNYLEAANNEPVGDGFAALLDDYQNKFLNQLRDHAWGALGKLFVFPVFAHGYNWTASNRDAGAKLKERIDQVIREARDQVGLCERVILITHSMGGLVARWASIQGAEGKILGIVHGVQPAFGAAAAYWRMKGGFESSGLLSFIVARILGPNGRTVTAVLANTVGGLQLLPNKHYCDDDWKRDWLRISGDPDPSRDFRLPKWSGGSALTDPYEDIYRVPAEPRPAAGNGATHNAFWGLVDPALLMPEQVTGDGNDTDALSLSMAEGTAWDEYLTNLKEAEAFHDELGAYLHRKTRMFHGTGLDTSDSISLPCSPEGWLSRTEPYPRNGFRGGYRAAGGKKMLAILQPPQGDGDGTVPVSSATMALTPRPKPDDPSDQAFAGIEHQKAYEGPAVHNYVYCAITALCKQRYQQMRG